MVDNQHEPIKEEKQSGSNESTTPGVPQNGEGRQSRWRHPERRLIVAAIAAVAAAVTTLFLPTMLLLVSNGEICPGYQVDVGMYYARLAPLTLVAAVIGFVVGMALPGLFGESKNRSLRVGCGMVAIAVGGVVCALAGFVRATYPGC